MNCRRTLILALSLQHKHQETLAVLEEGITICELMLPRLQTEEIGLLREMRNQVLCNNQQRKADTDPPIRYCQKGGKS